MQGVKRCEFFPFQAQGRQEPMVFPKASILSSHVYIHRTCYKSRIDLIHLWNIVYCACEDKPFSCVAVQCLVGGAIVG